MSLSRKKLLVLLTTLFMFFSFSSQAFASGEEESIFDKSKGLMSISYRGDTSLYPENSFEGILSAGEKGADMVSVGVDKTSDGIYVLTEKKKLSDVTDAPYERVNEVTYDELQKYYLYDNCGHLTQYRMVSLSQVIDSTEKDFVLILDADWSEKDGLYDLISHYGAFDRIILRTKESAKTVKEWLETKEEKMNVLAVYDGNIIFNAVSHFNTLSELHMPLVQYQSKNYFNVIFGSFFCQRFSDGDAPRAVAAMYDLDFSGQRNDSTEGWNELIEEGYSVIETNNIVSLVSYINRQEKMYNALSALTEKANNADMASNSSTLLKNRQDAVLYAETVLGSVSSLDEIEGAYSRLLLALNEDNLDSADDTQKGHLNVTFGKILATVLVGAVILAAQIYVYKMQEEKRRKN